MSVRRLDRAVSGQQHHQRNQRAPCQLPHAFADVGKKSLDDAAFEFIDDGYDIVFGKIARVVVHVWFPVRPEHRAMETKIRKSVN